MKRAYFEVQRRKITEDREKDYFYSSREEVDPGEWIRRRREGSLDAYPRPERFLKREREPEIIDDYYDYCYNIYLDGPRGRPRGRGEPIRGRGRGRGRGLYEEIERGPPLSCYRCKGIGHSGVHCTSDPARTDEICTICGGTGHFYKLCPNKRKRVPSRTPYGEEFYCYACGKPGHIARNCYNVV